MNDVQATLDAREAVHGDFTYRAAIAHALKAVVRGTPGYAAMSPVEREGTEMILDKISRACAGDPHHPDHWHDIAGYAVQVERSL